MQYYAIIVASGSGKRMEQELPKQFCLLNGRPVLEYALKAFAASRYKPNILLVLHPQFVEIWEKLLKAYKIDISHQIVLGGAERFHSVHNGLAQITGNGWVAIHDGARPLILSETIDRLYEEAEKYGNAIPVISSTESCRYQNKAIDRSDIKMVQTPQTFMLQQLREAYKQPYKAKFTDDASVVESLGINIHTTEGQETNIKLTLPKDFKIAAALLA